MSWYQVLAVLLLLYLPAADLPAAEPAPGPDTAQPPAPPPAGPSGERPEPPAPAPAERFTPSEKIDADSAVSFPVDI